MGVKWSNTLRSVPAPFLLIFVMITTILIYIFTVIFIDKSLLDDREGI